MQRHIDAIQTPIPSMRIIICILGILHILTSCGWQEAKEVIATAERMDKTEHVVYDDTAAISGVIRTLDNPVGWLFCRNTLGKAYYYMGRNYSLSNQIAEAAGCYIEADRLQIDDPIYRGRVNSCMAHICKQNNNSDSLALIFFERANQAFKESNNEWYYAHTLLDVIEFNCYLQHYSKADTLFQTAQSYLMDDAYYYARFLETKGLYFYSKQEYDSALVYFKQGLSHWKTEEDKAYTYLKLVQVYCDMEDLASALPYAEKIVQYSQNPNYLVNAYYCLLWDATVKDDAKLLAEIAHTRADIQQTLDRGISKYAKAIPLLKEYLSNPYPWRWGWISLVAVALVCLVAVIGVVVFRKRSLNAHKQIDDLSNRLEKQEAVQSEQQRQYDADMCLADIRAKFPKPRKQWNDYNRLKKDLNAPLQQLLYTLDNSDLGNKEKVFCVFLVVYSHCSLIELADYINYSEKGIRNYKQRIAQKLHISSAELYDFLQNQLRS